MSPRTGRPKIDNPKDMIVKVRFDKVLHSKLLAYCEENSITRTEAIRKAVLNLLSEK
ncbi:MAG: CopG family transcriptional regulator [Clostridia bacterium]|nr:CopG family transcriptional regulator [Clostridia bacterium]